MPADLAYLLGRAVSIGGLRPKCSVLDEDGSPAIGTFSSVDDTRSVVHGEVLVLQLARDTGIDAATARPVDADGTPVVTLVRRFDRTPSGERLLYASAAAPPILSDQEWPVASVAGAGVRRGSLRDVGR